MFKPASGVETGGPDRPPGARDVHPPVDVWVNTPRLLRSPVGHQSRTRPGVHTSYRVPGVLLQWAPTTTAAWLALVRYRLDATGGIGVTLVHYVPADFVSRRTPRDARRAR